jgi:N12 class adenine-specific DNA methylase
MKCQYLDEITGDRGIVFATGTPVTNTMSELYIMQRYLQRQRLKELGLAKPCFHTVTALGEKFVKSFCKFSPSCVLGSVKVV